MSATATKAPPRPAQTQQKSAPVAPQNPDLPSSDTPLLDAALDRPVAYIGQTVELWKRSTGEQAYNQIQRSLMQAEVQRRLRLALKPLMPRIMELMNTPLGFMTDKDPKRNRQCTETYNSEAIADAVIQGLMRGFAFTNNEMNVISGRFYPTAQGWEARLSEIEGLSVKPVPMFGVPELVNGRTTIRVFAEWVYNGERRKLTDGDGKPGRIYSLIVNTGASVDNLNGKAKGKALRDIYHIITSGQPAIESTSDEIEEVVGELIPEKEPPFDRAACIRSIAQQNSEAIKSGLLDATAFAGMLGEYEATNIDELTDDQLTEVEAQLAALFRSTEATAA